MRYYPYEKALLLISGLLACTMSLAATDPDRVALEAAIHQWMTAVNAQDVATLTRTMTEDVELLDNIVDGDRPRRCDTGAT